MNIEKMYKIFYGFMLKQKDYIALKCFSEYLCDT